MKFWVNRRESSHFHDADAIRPESLALSYQIESLYLQAVDLVKNGWQDRIRVEIQPDRKGIRVDYWRWVRNSGKPGRSDSPFARSARQIGQRPQRPKITRGRSPRESVA